VEFGRRTLSHHVVLTFFKRVRPTGLLKRKKTDTSTHLESQDGEAISPSPERGKWRRRKETVMNNIGFGLGD